jgi:membrane-bound ClpP family serine protease
MSWMIVLLLIIGGLSLLVLELLVVPGTTVVGVIGFILMAVGIWQSYVLYGTLIGSLILLVTLILSVGGFYLSLKSSTWNKAMLHKSIHSRVNQESNKLKVGDIGETTSRLNPIGKAFINNDFYEVSTHGDYLDSQIDVQVMEIKGTKIYVEPIKKEKSN